MGNQLPATDLDPVQVALAAYAAAARGAFAGSTERAVRADTAVFTGWCTAAGLDASLPIAPATAAAFVDAMAADLLPSDPSIIARALGFDSGSLSPTVAAGRRSGWGGGGGRPR